MVSDSKKTASGPRLPITQLIILSICRFAEPVALTSVYPYLPEMIQSFGIPQVEIAKWAGITSAVFSVSQCLTAIAWGRASDKYGRKPVILLAMTCAMTSSMLFGFSRSLSWAIFARALSGASNGNVGILRTTVAEMVPQRSLQPRAFATLPLVWQVGSIVGPVFGGALASPAAKFPGLFGKNEFLKKYPFALPNLVNGVIFVGGLLVGILFLRESLESKKYRRDYGRETGKAIARCVTRKKAPQSPRADYEALPSKREKGRDTRPTTFGYRDVFTTNSNYILVAYFILAFHQVAYDQLLPVFMHLPVNRENVQLPFKFGGGFGIDSGRIGVIFMVYGMFAMVAQFVIFPPIAAKYGSLKCMRWATLIYPIFYALTPYTVLMPTPFLQQASVLVVMLLKCLGGVFAFPCLTILLTNSAKSLQLLGTLNGVATSIAAIGRAFGPYSAGRTFTWSVESGYIVAAWWLLAFSAVLGHIITWWIVEDHGFGEPEKEVEHIHETIRLDGRVVATEEEDDAAAGLLATDSEDEEDDIDDKLEFEDDSLLSKGR